MIAVLAGFVAVALVGLLGLHEHEEAPSVATPLRDAPLAGVVIATLGIALAFGAQLGLVLYAAQTQVPFPTWFAALPLIAIDDRGPLYGHAPIGPYVAACAAIETIGCAVLYLVSRGRRYTKPLRGYVAAVAAVMLAAAIITPALTSFDLYAYVGSAHVPNAYHPPAISFNGDFALIDRIYGVPIFPSPYGPAWLALAHAVVAPCATLGAAVVALRALGALALVASVAALRALGARDGELAVALLNPGLIGYFVFDGHNDLVGVALILWAMALRERSAVASALLAIAAGGMKAPFLAIGTLAFARSARPVARLTGAAAVFAGGFALSAVFGGRDYLRAIRATSYLYRDALHDPVVNALHALLATTALAAIVLAVTTRRSWPTAAWSFLALAASVFGWYTVWGLPYAIFERRWLAPFLVSLPALAFLLSTTYARSLVEVLALQLSIVGAPLAVYIVLRGVPLTRKPANAGA